MRGSATSYYSKTPIIWFKRSKSREFANVSNAAEQILHKILSNSCWFRGQHTGTRFTPPTNTVNTNVCLVSTGRRNKGNEDCPWEWLLVVLDFCNLLICFVCVTECVSTWVYPVSHSWHVGQPSEQEKCIVGGLKIEQNGCLYSQDIIILRRTMVAESGAILTLMHSFVTVKKYLIVDTRNALRSFRFLRLCSGLCMCGTVFFLSAVGLHDINKIYNICCWILGQHDLQQVKKNVRFKVSVLGSWRFSMLLYCMLKNTELFCCHLTWHVWFG